MQGLDPAAAILRAHDRDRFQTTLFARPTARDALIALYAFDCEVGRVRHVVSQPMAGLIRLQWWRDALDGVAADRPLQHPVVRAMHSAWPMLGPHRNALDIAIDARESELEPKPIEAPSDLERHVEATGGVIGRTAAALLGAVQTADATAGVFRAHAIVRLIREIEADRREGRTMLPVRAASPDGTEGARAAVREAADMATNELHRARRAAPDPGDALPALLLAVPATAMLRRLARCAHDPQCLQRSPQAATPLRLSWAYVRGRF